MSLRQVSPRLRRGRPGPPALLVPNASGKGGRIELLYNGKDAADNSYRAGHAVFAADSPGRLLERSQAPFLSPTEPYERTGQVSAVTFVQGMAHVRGAWHLYYGTADSKIAVARVVKGRGRHALPRPGEGWRLPSRRAAAAPSTARRSSASWLLWCGAASAALVWCALLLLLLLLRHFGVVPL